MTLAFWSGRGLQDPPLPPPPGLDPNLLIEQLTPLVGFVLVLVFTGLVVRWLFRSPMGEAIAERIRARTRQRFEAGSSGGEIEGERFAALEQQVSALHRQLSEVAERVDFAERLLAERRERKLSAGQ